MHRTFPTNWVDTATDPRLCSLVRFPNRMLRVPAGWELELRRAAVSCHVRKRQMMYMELLMIVLLSHTNLFLQYWLLLEDLPIRREIPSPSHDG